MSFYFPSGKRIKDKKVVFDMQVLWCLLLFCPEGLDMIAGKSIYYKGSQY